MRISMQRRHERRLSRDVRREFWARVALRNQWRTLPPVEVARGSRARSFLVGVLIGVGAGVVALAAHELFLAFAVLAVVVGPLAAKG
ncbi:MAG: hypothetical protein IT460_06885 [Planctomycetes bacterium]|nr:hypothetical protein [Planctomycetota bacterium]